MNIEIVESSLIWADLSIKMSEIKSDWHGNTLSPPATYGFAIDQNNMWFVASHNSSPNPHPNARLGEFLPELWKYDVAEFFLRDPQTGHYLEFNLSPNGAWWSATFVAPLNPAEKNNRPFPGVVTYANMSADGGWLAGASIPLEYLRNKFNFGQESQLNTTFILNSPMQQFLTATHLGYGAPDFHRPDRFPKVRFFSKNSLVLHKPINKRERS